MTLTTGGVPADIPDSEIINGDHNGYIRFYGWPSPYSIEAWNGVQLYLSRSMSLKWTPTGFNLYQATIYKEWFLKKKIEPKTRYRVQFAAVLNETSL